MQHFCVKNCICDPLVVSVSVCVLGDLCGVNFVGGMRTPV